MKDTYIKRKRNDGEIYFREKGINYIEMYNITDIFNPQRLDSIEMETPYSITAIKI